MRTGLRSGPYYLGEETQSDLPVIVFPNNEEHQYEEHQSVVVGRFPFTKKYDAYAHAIAYCALPELMKALRRAATFQEKLSMRELSSDLMAEAMDIAYEGREALKKAESR